MRNGSDMTVFDRFYASDLILYSDNEDVTRVWQELREADVLGASLSIASLDGQVDEVSYAQMEAALALLQADPSGAADILFHVLHDVKDEEVRGALIFQSALCNEISGNYDAACIAYEQAMVLQPSRLDTVFSYAEFFFKNGNQFKAHELLEAACLKHCNPDFWAMWARLARKFSSMDTSKNVIKRALEKFPDNVEIKNVWIAWLIKNRQFHTALKVLGNLPDDLQHHPIVLTNKGSALQGEQRNKEALSAFEEALQHMPTLFQAQIGLASVLYTERDYERAEPMLLQALQKQPEHLEALVLLAKIYAQTKRYSKALELLENVIAIDPDCYSATYCLAEIYLDDFNFDLAEVYARRLPALEPTSFEAYNMLGLVLLALGQHHAACEAFETASQLTTSGAESSFSNLVYAQAYNPEISPEDLFHLHQGYGARYGGVENNLEDPFTNSVRHERRLKIGYVSPDFRAHSVAFFMVPIIENHSKDDFEIYAYSNASKVDRFTDWFADNVDHWRDIREKTLDNIRNMIRKDEIDILVDLAGHTADNLLPIFSRRSAPVQVSYLGYPNTTGVPAMDYRIVDDITDPVGEADKLASEHLVRLPDSFLCYKMVEGYPDVGRGPMLQNRPFTFGSFNNTIKLNDSVFKAWAEILSGVPGSQLLMKARPLASDGAREWIWRGSSKNTMSRGIV